LQPAQALLYDFVVGFFIGGVAFMSEDTGKIEQTEETVSADQKPKTELTAEDLDQVAGGAIDAYMFFEPPK
jgi:hypothetical protein